MSAAEGLPPGARALITGVTGQDGSFLAEELLGEGYEVFGLTRRDPSTDLGCSEPLRDRLALLQGDVLDPSTQARITELAPAEIYHLAAPTFVPDSWRDPAGTMAAIYGSAAALLALVAERLPGTRVFVAASGEMFGEATTSPQSEDTLCRPRTPYASAKLAAHELVGQLRAHHRLFAVSGILYNHESERRPDRFVTRKITRGAAAIALGRRRTLTLGDMTAVRDWSFAGDVLHGVHLALRHETPRDYIFASGVGHTVEEFVRVAFAHLGLDPAGHVEIDPSLVRAPESVAPVGDPARAREALGWVPTHDFVQLVARMVDADVAELSA
ncbi:MAG TPA: GDP-mannose 4,6-dehydratase [Solirubrobacteraceae bacterium]